MRQSVRILAIGSLVMVGLIGRAAAVNCGDGVAVCSCGDTVISDTVLGGADPVTDPLNICTGDGLKVAAGKHLDLDTNVIRGNGAAGFAGLRLLGGNTFVENGEVTGFATGVLGTVNLSTVKTIKADGNGVGIDLTGDQNVFDTNTASGNGGDGIRAIGSLNQVVDHNNAFGNGGHGIVVQGDTNFIENSSASQNGLDGFHIVGNSNTALTSAAYGNGGDGINLTGTGNVLTKNKAGDKSKGNGGDGIHAVGGRNTIRENLVYANGENGIDVSGGTAASPNVVLKNKVGDRGRGNGGNGIFVHADTGNGTATPNEVEGNTVKSNGGTGILIKTVIAPAQATTIGAVSAASTTVAIGVNPTTLGFPASGTAVLGGSDVFAYNGVSATGFTGVTAIDQRFPEGTTVTSPAPESPTKGHALKNNASGGPSDQANAVCQFDVVADNFNATGNKANGVTVTPNTNGAPFPTGCLN